MFDVSVDIENTDMTVCVEGRLDTSSAPVLEDRVRENIDGITRLVFDLKGLDYISSSGLRVLLSAQKVMNKQGEMLVSNVGENIMEIFDVTGFTDILTIV